MLTKFENLSSKEMRLSVSKPTLLTKKELFKKCANAYQCLPFGGKHFTGIFHSISSQLLYQI